MKHIPVAVLLIVLLTAIGCSNIRPFVKQGGSQQSPITGLCYDSNPSTTSTMCDGQESAPTEESPIIKESPMSFSEKLAWTMLVGIGSYVAYDQYRDAKDKKPVPGTTTSGDVNSTTITGDGNTVIFGGNQPVTGGE